MRFWTGILALTMLIQDIYFAHCYNNAQALYDFDEGAEMDSEYYSPYQSPAVFPGPGARTRENTVAAMGKEELSHAGMVTPFAVPLSFATDFSFPLSAASSNGDEAYDSVEAMALESLPGGIVEADSREPNDITVWTQYNIAGNFLPPKNIAGSVDVHRKDGDRPSGSSEDTKMNVTYSFNTVITSKTTATMSFASAVLAEILKTHVKPLTSLQTRNEENDRSFVLNLPGAALNTWNYKLETLDNSTFTATTDTSDGRVLVLNFTIPITGYSVTFNFTVPGTASVKLGASNGSFVNSDRAPGKGLSGWDGGADPYWYHHKTFSTRTGISTVFHAVSALSTSLLPRLSTEASQSVSSTSSGSLDTNERSAGGAASPAKVFGTTVTTSTPVTTQTSNGGISGALIGIIAGVVGVFSLCFIIFLLWRFKFRDG